MGEVGTDAALLLLMNHVKMMYPLSLYKSPHMAARKSWLNFPKYQQHWAWGKQGCA